MIIRRGKPARDNRCGVDSRTAWTCAPCKIVSQLRHNHVVPALTGRCICVWSMYKYSLSRLCIFAVVLTPLYVSAEYLIFFSRGETRRVNLCTIHKSRNHHVVVFPISPLFSFVSFHSFPIPFPFLFASLPHSSPYIPMYVYMYIYIYSESSRLILGEKARESKVTPASDISPS